jgi:hypothetical protein
VTIAIIVGVWVGAAGAVGALCKIAAQSDSRMPPPPKRDEDRP